MMSEFRESYGAIKKVSFSFSLSIYLKSLNTLLVEKSYIYALNLKFYYLKLRELRRRRRNKYVFELGTYEKVVLFIFIIK